MTSPRFEIQFFLYLDYLPPTVTETSIRYYLNYGEKRQTCLSMIMSLILQQLVKLVIVTITTCKIREAHISRAITLSRRPLTSCCGIGEYYTNSPAVKVSEEVFPVIKFFLAGRSFKVVVNGHSTGLLEINARFHQSFV